MYHTALFKDGAEVLRTVLRQLQPPPTGIAQTQPSVRPPSRPTVYPKASPSSLASPSSSISTGASASAFASEAASFLPTAGPSGASPRQRPPVTDNAPANLCSPRHQPAFNSRQLLPLLHKVGTLPVFPHQRRGSSAHSWLERSADKYADLDRFPDRLGRIRQRVFFE
ncbi:unnamed protein product [Protopolystoma xenopodis]|uniref:Uncharacterized protein n=1 Tax=Protopolystoma xenopodis TaxID=117903 RepID=A0A3S5A869_9PLAT|nr:unnamed protein product [Protopolystoma xenopodis]